MSFSLVSFPHPFQEAVSVLRVCNMLSVHIYSHGESVDPNLLVYNSIASGMLGDSSALLLLHSNLPAALALNSAHSLDISTTLLVNLVRICPKQQLLLRPLCLSFWGVLAGSCLSQRLVYITFDHSIFDPLL